MKTNNPRYTPQRPLNHSCNQQNITSGVSKSGSYNIAGSRSTFYLNHQENFQRPNKVSLLKILVLLIIFMGPCFSAASRHLTPDLTFSIIPGKSLQSVSLIVPKIPCERYKGKDAISMDLKVVLVLFYINESSKIDLSYIGPDSSTGEQIPNKDKKFSLQGPEIRVMEFDFGRIEDLFGLIGEPSPSLVEGETITIANHLMSGFFGLGKKLKKDYSMIDLKKIKAALKHAKKVEFESKELFEPEIEDIEDVISGTNGKVGKFAWFVMNFRAFLTEISLMNVKPEINFGLELFRPEKIEESTGNSNIILKIRTLYGYLIAKNDEYIAYSRDMETDDDVKRFKNFMEMEPRVS